MHMFWKTSAKWGYTLLMICYKEREGTAELSENNNRFRRFTFYNVRKTSRIVNTVIQTGTKHPATISSQSHLHPIRS